MPRTARNITAEPILLEPLRVAVIDAAFAWRAALCTGNRERRNLAQQALCRALTVLEEAQAAEGQETA